MHVLSFASSDEHSTAEGRNAYITRVKGFLIFLKDNDVIDLYIDSRIIGRFRNKKTLIKIIRCKLASLVCVEDCRTAVFFDCFSKQVCVLQRVHRVEHAPGSLIPLGASQQVAHAPACGSPPCC